MVKKEKKEVEEQEKKIDVNEVGLDKSIPYTTRQRIMNEVN